MLGTTARHTMASCRSPTRPAITPVDLRYAVARFPKIQKISKPKNEVDIALVGKYIPVILQ